MPNQLCQDRPRPSLKIALIGYGKMGRMVEAIALERGHRIVPLEEAFVCIDFTRPEAALPNVQKLAPLGKNIVMGTTGWYEQLPEVEKLVKQHAIGFLYAPNFSLGVQLFLQVVAEAAKRYLSHEEYSVGGYELHHAAKKDAPSGTAKALMERVGRPMEFAAIRCGSIPGTHTLIFDSKADTITLQHEARSREGFALGAVKAAEWLTGKKGFYTMEDMFSC